MVRCRLSGRVIAYFVDIHMVRTCRVSLDSELGKYIWGTYPHGAMITVLQGVYRL